MVASFQIREGKIVIGHDLDEGQPLAILSGVPKPATINFRENERITSLGLRLLSQILQHYNGEVFFEDCTDSILTAMSLSPCFIPRNPEDAIRSILVPWLEEDGSQSSKSLLVKDCEKLVAGGSTFFKGKPYNLDWLKMALEFKNVEDNTKKDDLNINLRSLIHDIQANLRHSEDLAMSLDASTENLFRRLLRRTRSMVSEIERTAISKDTMRVVDYLDVHLLAEEFAAIFQENGKTLRFSGSNRIAIEGDSLSIERVLSSLLFNSLKACKTTTYLTCEQTKEFSYLTVEDDGSGIPDDLVSAVFSLGGTFGKKEGTGLGLHTAKRTLEEFGGTLNYSHSNGLAKFKASLPIPKTNASETSCQILIVTNSDSLASHYKGQISQIGLVHNVTHIRPSHFHRDLHFHLLISNDQRSLHTAHELGKLSIFANLSASKAILEDALNDLHREH